MADIRAPISEPFETTFYARATGLAGTVAYKILDNEGNTVLVSTTAGVTEIADGLYAANPAAPGTEGQWSVVWSKDGTYDEHTLGVDALTTYDPGVSPPTVGDLVPMTDDTGLQVGPCQAWTTSEEVAACCTGTDIGSDTGDYDESVVAASQLLYALVPRFSGECGPRRVFPCGVSACNGPWGTGAAVVWTGTGWQWDWGAVVDPPARATGCGCTPLDEIPLAGWVREILEVTIDGALVDPDTYEIRDHRRLVRVRASADDTNEGWPGCAAHDLPYTEPGTFSVLYTYGLPVPAMGQLAARELACAIFKACPGNAALDETCALPNNVVKVTRQGIEIVLKDFTGWAFTASSNRGGASAGWVTGMPMVDAFLNAYNPYGRRKRRTTVWSPDLPRHPMRGAVETGS